PVLFPLPGLELAFYIHLGALAQVILRYLGEAFAENHHAVPFGPLTRLTCVAIAPALGGGNAQIDHGAAAGQRPHLGIGAQIAYQNDLVHASRHVMPSCLLSAGRWARPVTLGAHYSRS